MTNEPPANRVAGAPRTQEHSFASLNFLRGLSAFVVLFSHTVNAVAGPQPLFAQTFGPMAVDVFMLISGFLMMWHFYERRHLGEEWGSSKTCLKFYTRRFFRIAPLYYCVLLVVYLGHDGLQHSLSETRAELHQAEPRGPHDPTTDELSVAQVASHFTFLFGFIPRFAQSNPLPDWSIGLEMQFYLFFPFLALLLVRTQFVGGVVLMLAANALALRLFGVGTDAAPGPLGVFPYPTFLPLRLTCFLVGMLLAAGLFEKAHPAKRAFLLMLALLVAGLYMKKFLVICFVFALYELACAGGTGLPGLDHLIKRAGAFVEFKVCKFAADASYGVYCLHLPLLIVLVRLLCMYSPFAELSQPRRFLICFALIIPLVYAVAWLAFKYIETPGIALGRKLVKRIR